MLTLARSVSERGELVLLRRADGSLELRVNGLFAMDTSETTTERLLALHVLGTREESSTPLTVLVGGLGLGFTVSALLEDPRVARVVVAEIEPDLVRWHRDSIVPCVGGSGVLDDRRVEVVVDDVRAAVARSPEPTYDIVLLDVDNGPGFLLHDSNAPIYHEPFLTACRDVLRPGGAIAVWSASESSVLASAIVSVFGSVDEIAIPVTLNERHTTYHLYVGRNSRAPAPQGSSHAG